MLEAEWNNEEELALALEASMDIALEEQVAQATTILLEEFSDSFPFLELFSHYPVRVILLLCPCSFSYMVQF